MPKLTRYTRQVTPTQGQNVIRASVDSMGGGGKGMIQAGADIQNFATKIKETGDKRDAVAIEKALIDGSVEMDAFRTDLEKNAQEGGVGHTDAVNAGIAKWSDKFKENYSGVSPENRQRLELGVARLRASQVSRSMTFEATASAKKARSDVEGGLDSLKNQVIDGSMPLDDALNQGTSLIVAAGLDAGLQRDLLDAWRSDATSSRIDFRIREADSPQEIAALKGEVSKLREKMDPKDYEAALNKIDYAEEQQIAQQRIALTDDYNAAVKVEQAGIESGMTEDEVAASSDNPVVSARRVENFRAAREEGEARRSLENSTPTEAAVMIAGAQQAAQEAGDPEEKLRFLQQASRLTQAENARRTEIAADPVKYVMKHDRVGKIGAAYETYSAAVQAAQGGNQADVTQATLAFDRYAEVVKAAQARLGITDPRLLTETQVAQISNTVASVERTPEGAQELVNTLGGYYNQYGAKHWPTVYRQLVQDDALSGTHGVIARMAGDPTKNTVSVQLATAATMGKELVPDQKVRNEISDAVAATSWSDFAGTFAAQGAFRERNQYKESIDTLAAYYTTQGMSQSDAAKTAYENIVGKDFKVVGSYRIPASTVSGSPMQTDAVERGARRAKADLMSIDLVPPVDGLPKDQQVSSLKTFGRWINSPNGDGLMLTDEQGRPVDAYMDSEGVEVGPVIYTWDDLTSIGSQRGGRTTTREMQRGRRR